MDGRKRRKEIVYELPHDESNSELVKQQALFSSHEDYANFKLDSSSSSSSSSDSFSYSSERARGMEQKIEIGPLDKAQNSYRPENEPQKIDAPKLDFQEDNLLVASVEIAVEGGEDSEHHLSEDSFGDELLAENDDSRQLSDVLLVEDCPLNALAI